MYLEKLELKGFKSFASKTSLEFSKPSLADTQGFKITGIVGPNGSGKSNIADAIRWVLGEQSMKLLRSKKGEDVIFAGTKQKSRLGLAEVSLCLNNEDKKMPIDYSLVSISRRMFRDGEVEYLINKNKVRLLDVQTLLAQAGFGQKTYSVIGQGMIDSLLYSTPSERRELFEEAAGIKQYQIKRNISLNKLNATKQNLLRVADLLNEIKPRLRSLKRQANKAQKKEGMENELLKLQKKYFNYLWNHLQAKIKEQENEFSKIEREEKILQEKLKNIQEDLDIKEKEIKSTDSLEKEKKLESLRTERNDFQEKLAVTRGRIKICEEKELTINVEELNQKIDNLNEEIEILKQKFSKHDQLLKKSKTDLENKFKGENDILSKIKEIQNKLTIFQNNKESSGLREIEKRLKKIYENQIKFLEKLKKCCDLTELRKMEAIIEKDVKDIKNILDEIKQGEAEPKTQDSLQLQRQLSQLLEDKNQLAEQTNKIKIDIATLSAQEEAIENLISSKNKEKNDIQKRITDSKNPQMIKTKQLDDLLKQKKQIESAVLKLDTEIADLQKGIEKESKLEEERKNRIFLLEKDYRIKQDEINKLRDEIREAGIKQAKINAQQENLLSQIKRDLNLDAEKISEEFKKEEKIELNNEDFLKLESRIEGFKQDLYKIGEIDPTVVQEFKETNERYDFLNRQSEDLKQAIVSSKKVISELDQTIDKLFNNAFKNINKSFKKYFEIIFGGGKAKLIKYKLDSFEETKDREDKNKDQSLFIDIKANPPGKKVKSLSMLSGGEKALTSLALLFAIIDCNPSPFIVLDEVDASLDEANSRRFGRILESVAKKTQFIVITHNRETMKKANLLYGVTMGGDGISKLLSVKLENN